MDKLAAAAAEETFTPSKHDYLEHAKTQGWAPGAHGDGSPEQIDLTNHLAEPIEGLAGLESLRQRGQADIAGLIKKYPTLEGISSTPEFQQWAICAFLDHGGELLLDKVTKCRREMGKVVRAVHKYAPGRDATAVRNSPGKVDKLASTLAEGDEDATNKHLQAFSKTLHAGCESIEAALRNAAKAKDPTLDIATLPPEQAGIDVLKAMLQAYSKSKKPEHTTLAFGRFAAEIIDKNAAAANLAKQKGEPEVALHLVTHGMRLRDAMNDFMSMAHKIGFKQARDLYSAIGDPFSSINKASWDVAVALAGNGKFADAIQALGANFPCSAVKGRFKKRTRKSTQAFCYDYGSSSSSSDSDTDSERRSKRSRPYKKGQGHKPRCSYCGGNNHTYEKCFKRLGKERAAKAADK